MTTNATAILDGPLPHSDEAESAVLGAILWDNANYFRVAGLITEEDLFHEKHRRIFAIMREWSGQQQVVDLVTLKDELEKRKQLAAAGGAAYLASLVDGIPDLARVEKYAAIVARHAKLRRLIAIGNAMMRDAMEGLDEPEEIATSVLERVSGISVEKDARVRPMFEVIGESFAAADRRLRGEAVGALRSGLPHLDRARALRRTLVVIGAPSNHGKTAVMVNFAEALAANGQTTAIFTLESTEEEASNRYVSAVSGVPHSRVQDWSLMTASDFHKIGEAHKQSRNKRIFVTRRIRSLDQILAECRRLKMQEGLDAAFIDYFQIIRCAGFRASEREAQMAHVAQTLLEFAVDNQIMIAPLSQLNKERRRRENGRIYIDDLKYASAIGESARVVLLFQRPYADDKSSGANPHHVLFQIEKNNENVCGDFEAHFDEVTQAFGEGDCEANDCRSLSKKPAEPRLFA